MITSLWLAAWLACAQIPPAENKPAATTSKIDTVTIYRGQALVTREVVVPEGLGTLELMVSPISPLIVESSLYTEGTEGLRILGTRSKIEAVTDDSQKQIQAVNDRIKTLQANGERIQNEIAVQRQDLQYLQKLEGFTGTNLSALTEKGRLESAEIIKLSQFVMENRQSRSKVEVELKQKLQENAEAQASAQKALSGLSNRADKTIREAVITVQKTKAEAGAVRLSYLVNSADWQPQYRLRGADEAAPVRLEYLAAVHQETGESWSNARLILSTARPSLDASPPEFLPLKIANAPDAEPQEAVVANDPRSAKVAAELTRVVSLNFANDTPLEEVLKTVQSLTQGPNFPQGISVYVDPVGLADAEQKMSSPIRFNVPDVTLKTALKLMLDQLGLVYSIKDGLLMITGNDHSDEFDDNLASQSRRSQGMGGGMGGGGMFSDNLSLEQVQAQGGAVLNSAAADDQAQELNVSEGRNTEIAATEKDTPIVIFNVEDRLDIPSRREPQLIEVARAELTAEYYAKAVPVLTSRVYRLAKLSNKSDLVLLPGEASVYSGTNLVGRMRLPLVAAGEPFIAGFGVDPQIQVSRRLVEKSRVLQGGNQVFNYEFRIGLRNYHSKPVKVQLWDRLPKSEGEAVGVNLTKTSIPISADPLYLRSARLDNLLLWDIDLKENTVGDKTLYVNYEFRLEYARDMPTPKFDSGGLREAPIGGGAMGGMGGGMGGGGFR